MKLERRGRRAPSFSPTSRTGATAIARPRNGATSDRCPREGAMARSRSAIGKSRAVFSLRLKRLRIEAGLTQKDLERLSGIPKSRLSRYENGHLLPSFQGLR